MHYKNLQAIFLLLFLFVNLSFGQVYKTEVIGKDIRTLQLKVFDNNLTYPVIELNSSDFVQISFDEMSHNNHMYSYSVHHCNADWTLSELLPIEYIDGFTTDIISLFETSVNTTVLYTHYSFSLPNDNIRLKLSGNYLVKIYEDNNPSNIVATACFSVVEQRLIIDGKLRGNTDTDINGKLQQLDFDIYTKGYLIKDPISELKVVVMQNERTDNKVVGVKPTYIGKDRLNYANNISLIFEGGSEYQSFDFSSLYTFGGNIEQITYKAPFYNVQLMNDRISPRAPYNEIPDVNGKYIVHLQRSSNVNSESDYMYVYFTLPAEQPFFDGSLYLLGNFNHNQLDEKVRMNYNLKRKAYEQTILLKQGGYNYQYVFVPKGESVATTTRVSGSYWQTKNEYLIYVYHRPFGERYDKLIGMKVISK